MTSQTSIARTVDIGKMWARIYRHASPALVQLAGRVAETADFDRIEKLREEMQDELRQDPASAAKYADHRLWLPFNIGRIASLSLHKSSSLRMLDIGCGPGYFLAAARACGHDVYGIDAPGSFMTGVERRVYAELLAALSLTARVSPLLVERFTPMALPQGNLDLITAFWICFNCHRREDEWGAAEWNYFVEDALSWLRPDGQLHLELNAHPERYGSLQWYDAEILQFFRSAGSVEGNVVRIRKH